MNKDNVGVYVSLGLVGAGLGLLVGSVIKELVLRRRAVSIEIEEAEGDYSVDEEEDQKEEDELAVVKGVLARGNTEEQIRLLELYKVPSMAWKMYKGGVVDSDAFADFIVNGEMEKEDEEDIPPVKKAEQHNYRAIIYPGSEKPDLVQLVRDDSLELEAIEAQVEENSRWPLLEFEYDPEDETLMYLSARGNPVVSSKSAVAKKFKINEEEIDYGIQELERGVKELILGSNLETFVLKISDDMEDHPDLDVEDAD